LTYRLLCNRNHGSMWGRAVPAFLMRPKGPKNPTGVHTKRKGRLRCHKRPESREETPKEGSDSGERYRTP